MNCPKLIIRVAWLPIPPQYHKSLCKRHNRQLPTLLIYQPNSKQLLNLSLSRLHSNNQMFQRSNLLKPIASVPVVIFQYAMSPFDDWHALAWAGALVLTLFVLVLSLASRLILLRNRSH